MSAELNSREVPPISAMMLRFFERIVRAYFRRHFRAVMVQHAERFTAMEGPLIVYANHSSWWDPMVSILLAQMLLPGLGHYAPMDASALKRYPILGKIGIFPVEMSSARGAAQFLRTSKAILESGGVVWITPQGRFADPREFPLAFKPGLGALAVRAGDVTLLPLAIEYSFWDERLPETLLRFGDPLRIEPGCSAETATQRLEAALAAVMQDLKTAAIARDASAFRVLLSGSRGTGGFYGLGRRMRALFTRKPVQLDHTERSEITTAKDKS
ncbi:MAG TPA: lysophospholipid acyltransferase family protein [Acidobacteriaceae bacterium]